MERAKKIADWVPEGYEKKTIVEKTVVWEGDNDVPEIIRIEGENKKVKYMRDGIILFEDNSSATYKRIKDLRDGDSIAILEITYNVKKEK